MEGKSRTTACLLLAMLATTLLLGRVHGQRLYGVSASKDSLWGIDTTSWAVVQRSKLTMTGHSIMGSKGLAWDPIHHLAYVLLRTSALPNSTQLATLNLSNGVATHIADLGRPFSAITFREDGQLFGVVEDGAPQEEQLFLVDKVTGTTTLATVLGNGDAGEVVAYLHGDGNIYHWSGSATPIMERLPATAPFGPVTSIPITGASPLQVSAALGTTNSGFIIALTDNTLRRQSNTGQLSTGIATFSTTITGLVLPPTFRLLDASVCPNVPAVVEMNGLAWDTLVVFWGDGNQSSGFPASSLSHYYTTGAYVIHTCLRNPQSGLDTLSSMNITVLNLPGVVLYPGNDTIICAEDSLLITGAFGGTSRWYRNGLLIPGATNYQYSATQNGLYNMAKTNMNGCTDSAAVGIFVAFANQATPVIHMDTSGCPTVIFGATSPFASSWNWTFGDGGTGGAAFPAHTYSAPGTYPVQVTVTNVCGSFTGSTNLVIDCPIAIEEGMDEQWSVYPNPCNETLHLRLEDPLREDAILRVTNLLGKEVHHEKWPAGTAINQELRLPHGGYLIQIDGEGIHLHTKVLVR